MKFAELIACDSQIMQAVPMRASHAARLKRWAVRVMTLFVNESHYEPLRAYFRSISSYRNADAVNRRCKVFSRAASVAQDELAYGRPKSLVRKRTSRIP